MEMEGERSRHSIAGNVGIAVVVTTFILVVIAFTTSHWIDSDYREREAKLDHLGLWSHCFRSLQNPYSSYNRDEYYRGCRGIYDPFRTDHIHNREFLVPRFMIITQFFFTLCLISILLSVILIFMYFMCFVKNVKQFLMLIRLNAWILLIGGLMGLVAILAFSLFGNKNGWLPGEVNNFYGWSFILACIGDVLCFVAAALFFKDGYVQSRRENFRIQMNSLS